MPKTAKDVTQFFAEIIKQREIQQESISIKSHQAQSAVFLTALILDVRPFQQSESESSMPASLIKRLNIVLHDPAYLMSSLWFITTLSSWVPGKWPMKL